MRNISMGSNPVIEVYLDLSYISFFLHKNNQIYL